MTVPEKQVQENKIYMRVVQENKNQRMGLFGNMFDCGEDTQNEHH